MLVRWPYRFPTTGDLTDWGPVTQSQPAGLYMFTSDSPFNAEMNDYMIHGTVINPPLQVHLEASANITGGLSLELLNTTTNGTEMFLVDDSTE